MDIDVREKILTAAREHGLFDNMTDDEVKAICESEDLGAWTLLTLLCILWRLDENMRR